MEAREVVERESQAADGTAALGDDAPDSGLEYASQLEGAQSQ